MTSRFIAPALACAALAGAQAAQAQQTVCVAGADLSDAVVYVMPIAFDAARTACQNRLSQGGFMATRGEAFVAPFRAGQDRAWPGALRLIKTFMDRNGAEAAAQSGFDIDAMLEQMPAETVRPLVDALVGQMIAGEIKGDACAKIERGMELVSPLPADNVGALIAFMAEVADVKNPPLCAATVTSPAAGGTRE